MQPQKYLIVMKYLAISFPFIGFFGFGSIAMEFEKYIENSRGAFTSAASALILSGCIIGVVLGVVYNNERKSVRNPKSVVIIECFATAAPVVGLELAMLVLGEGTWASLYWGFIASFILGLVCFFHPKRVILPSGGMIASMAISAVVIVATLIIFVQVKMG